MQIRNIAIIAHVDHGKTTLTNKLMQQTGMTASGVSMDSNVIELERGITIYSKNTSVMYNGVKINIVDTPGHADFGSEVERVLRSIDSVLLVVDAQEGPMPQTKFVLKKSLQLGLKPIVVINKIDKPAARVEWTLEKVYELFLDLGASNDQLNFTTIYAIARQGIAKRNMADQSDNLNPLLDVILEKVKPASSVKQAALPLRIQPFNLAYDNFIGRLAIGRIYEGMVKQADNVIIKKSDGEIRTGKIGKLFTFEGINRKEVKQAQAGDIVMIAGLPNIDIGETICLTADQETLPAILVDQPTISLNFLVNNSPFAGRDGKYVTSRQIKERLQKELEVNVGLKIDFTDGDYYKVYGRGELHIAILLENMRREGFELQVSQPTVIIKEENGVKLEPFEQVTIDVPQELSGVVIEKMAKRKGLMKEMNPEHAGVRMVFEIPARGFLGYGNEFMVDTRGQGIICTHMVGFKPHVGEIFKSELGSMVSMVSGKALAFSLWNFQARGTLYIGANTEVYEGMVIGNVAKGNDLEVNPVKGKQLTNMRASGTDEAIKLIPPYDITLERGLGIMKEDEYLEVTSKHIRLRKIYLTKNDRTKAGRIK
ncbi:translational GTPase TypA [Patescibacteria group bacterium]|nr:translational GTPase TypA [Patescibacteria group bacterium]MBU1663506.1 translational GTPase TypA [Patescibacteria group bacterium]MBU1934001.1 translational GTPase TypA [Patescibacteria group bacterium]MBU2008179.1 translational GTPase TypA [Patescibacteria group bacterium]MBU2233909.1 translational GTPase TypA [Patescibacteria group bacterium]